MGVLYLLPRATFEQHPPRKRGGVIYQSAECAGEQTVRPLGYLRIGADDFPFLDQVRGHDKAIIQARADADPQGWPWIEG